MSNQNRRRFITNTHHSYAEVAPLLSAKGYRVIIPHLRGYDDFERRLAQGPVINVPTITLEGDANGAPHPDANVYAKKFSGKYTHRVIKGGVGHNLPQEAPQAFADAVIEVDGY
jgi:hypothetical protein